MPWAHSYDSYEKSKLCKGYATFDVTTEEDAVKAITELNGNTIFGDAIKVQFDRGSRWERNGPSNIWREDVEMGDSSTKLPTLPTLSKVQKDREKKLIRNDQRFDVGGGYVGES